MDCCYEIKLEIGKKSCDFFESVFPDIIKSSILVDIVRACNFFQFYFPSIIYDKDGIFVRLFVYCESFDEFCEGYYFFKEMVYHAIAWCCTPFKEAIKSNGDMFCTWEHWHGLIL